jgi:hypothetical protein
MSARLSPCLVLVAATTLGCGVGGPSTVTLTDLVVTPDGSGSTRSGTFNVHVSRPENADGSSGIRLHHLVINSDPTDLSSVALSLAKLTGELPGDVNPGEEIVTPLGFELTNPVFLGLPPFDSCVAPDGFSLAGTYFDDAEGGFFPIRSEPTWFFTKPLTGITWGTTLGDEHAQIGRGIAVFPDGSSAVVGATFNDEFSAQTPSLGGTPTPFLSRIDAGGAIVWSHDAKLTAPDPVDAFTQGPSLIAAAPNGEIVVAGNLDGTLDLGGGSVSIASAGATDVFLARFDAAGKPLETKIWGDSLAQTVTAMDVDAAGDVILAGTLAGAMDFGNGPIAPLIDPAFTSVYVAKLAVSGAPIYAKVPLVLEFALDFSAAVGPEGTVILGGSYSGGAWISGVAQPKAQIDTGLLIKLAVDGSVAWSSVLEGADVVKVAIDEGDVVAVINVLDIPGKAIVGGVELQGGNSGKTFLTRFDPAGALRYAIPLGGGGSFDRMTLVVDGAGHSLLSGAILQTLTLEGPEADLQGRPSAFLKELDRNGSMIRSMAFGCATPPVQLAVARSGARDPLLLSTFFGATDFGKGITRAAGGSDLLVVKLPAK